MTCDFCRVPMDILSRPTLTSILLWWICPKCHGTKTGDEA